MKLARLLFKPKWQDKNPAVRRAALIYDTEAEMLAALPEIARNDPDSGVRLAALKRLQDYECWRERSTADADGEIRLRARSEYLALLCSSAEGVPPLRRRIAELDTLTPAEIEKVATLASDRALRVAALGRVTRVGLLTERAIADPDPQLRLAVLELIADAAALERIAERARKTDKAVSRSARARLEAMRFDAGDTVAINERARGFCERIEALMRSPGSDTEAVRAEIRRGWDALGPVIAPDLVSRYRGADMLVQQTLKNAQDGLLVAQTITLSDDTRTETPDSTESFREVVASASESQAQAAPALVSQVRFDAALAMAAADARHEQEKRQARLDQVENLIPRYAAALETGDVAAAHGLHFELAAHTAALGSAANHFDKRVAPLHTRYIELKHWQHWSNQQRRKALCAEIEALAGTGAHPDALATRVREAREEWQRLDASEGSVQRHEGGMTRRFHALCQQVLKPTRSYFDKRSELRDLHQEQLHALLDRADAMSEDDSDWKALIALRLELGNALRTLDGVDPRTRTTLAKRLKATIAQIVPRIEAHEQDVEKARLRLIERATALTQGSDQKLALREVRELQKQWTALGQGKRGTDQRQWRAFRAACDAVFGKLDTERKEKDAQADAARVQVQALLEEFETLAADSSLPSDVLKSRLRDLELRWQAAKPDDRSLEQRHRSARDAIAAHLGALGRNESLSRFTSALEKYSLLRELETRKQTVAAVAPRWNSAPALLPAFAGPLDARYALASTATLEAPAVDEVADAEPAHDLLVRIEFLAGLPSPSEDRQRRMDYQVQRLSARMRGGSAAETPGNELTALLTQWFALTGPIALQTDARFLIAAKTAIEALP